MAVFWHWLILLCFLFLGHMAQTFARSMASLMNVPYRWTLAVAIAFMGAASAIFAMGAAVVPTLMGR